MIAFFARHPTAGNLLMVIFLLAGLMAIPGLSRETFPDFAASQVEVRVAYPGASAEDIEEAICGRIEDALDEVDAVEEVGGGADAHGVAGALWGELGEGGVERGVAAAGGVDEVGGRRGDGVLGEQAVVDGSSTAGLFTHCQGL